MKTSSFLHVRALAVMVLVFVGSRYAAVVAERTVQNQERKAMRKARERACKVYCSGDLLDAVQRYHIFNDSKYFVDMPMKHDPEQILSLFQQLPRPLTRKALAEFVTSNFFDAGSDVVSCVPEDWTEKPSLLSKLRSKESIAWADDLNQKWKILGRRTAESVAKYPHRTSTLHRALPFIVPGGRFRESYYWDTYWIILGLIECDMVKTSKHIVLNLLQDVETFGFVPNGGRVYYTTRTQPPLLTKMVEAVYLADSKGGEEGKKDTTFLGRALPILDAEYDFWMSSKNGRLVSVPVPGTDAPGESVRLNRYFSKDNTPRPESYREDIDTIEKKGGGGGGGKTIAREIRAAAESGWDFSSRWMMQEGRSKNYSMTTLATTQIVPIDLNAFLYSMEKTLSDLHAEVATASAPKALYYMEQARQRKNAIFRIMAFPLDTDFKEKEKNKGGGDCAAVPCEFDDVMLSTGERARTISDDNSSSSKSAASFVPLWAGLCEHWNEHEKDTFVEKVVLSSPLLLQGGVATTNIDSKQQWDYPNAWPPLQLLLIHGLLKLSTHKAKATAASVAQSWLQSNYKAWVPNADMYEKYNARVCGEGGGGGEYGVQVGFGWSNGVVLSLLAVWPDTKLKDACR